MTIRATPNVARAGTTRPRRPDECPPRIRSLADLAVPADRSNRPNRTAPDPGERPRAAADERMQQQEGPLVTATVRRLLPLPAGRAPIDPAACRRRTPGRSRTVASWRPRAPRRTTPARPHPAGRPEVHTTPRRSHILFAEQSLANVRGAFVSSVGAAAVRQPAAVGCVVRWR
jgi:hypothetical protein